MAQIKELVFDRTITKRPCLYEKIDGAYYPVVYFQKAKGVPDEKFEQVLKILMPYIGNNS